MDNVFYSTCHSPNSIDCNLFDVLVEQLQLFVSVIIIIIIFTIIIVDFIRFDKKNTNAFELGCIFLPRYFI